MDHLNNNLIKIRRKENENSAHTAHCNRVQQKAAADFYFSLFSFFSFVLFSFWRNCNSLFRVDAAKNNYRCAPVAATAGL